MMNVVGRIKPIRLSEHARLRLASRGTTEQEVGEAIRSAEWRAVHGNRLECRRTFPFDSEWNGRHYDAKTVRPWTRRARSWS